MLKINPTRRLLPILLLLLFCPLAGAQEYRILITNDDGVDSPLLAELKLQLEALPDTEVVVSAPDANQSGSSHASIGAEFEVTRVMRDGEFFGYSVSGRPADAVRYALLTLGSEEPFDLVVSGINLGANVGDVSHLSGTVGAAMEAQYHGIPSIAVSQATSEVNTRESARFAARVVEKLRRDGPLPGVVLSINIPGGVLKGVRVRPVGDSYLQTEGYEELSVQGDRMAVRRIRTIATSEDRVTDTYAYQNGYITITPLKFDWTAYELIPEVESWDLE
ncbi:MAG: 5'/3'-nucleotidase SurE [Pseudohongiellaceae bacterium]